METNLKTLNVSDSLRGTGLDPVRAATALSLMLLWSQRPASKLDDLPSFKNVSAEYVLADPLKIAASLYEEDTRAVAHVLAELRPSELENSTPRINALDAGHRPAISLKPFLPTARPKRGPLRSVPTYCLRFLMPRKVSEFCVRFLT